MKKPASLILLILLLFVLKSNCEGEHNDQKRSYSGSQLWKIHIGDPSYTMGILQRLQDKDYLALWGKNATTIDALINPDAVDKVRGELGRHRLKYHITITDIQQAIDEENPPAETEQELQERLGHKMSWKSYHRLDDIYNFLDYLADTYPKLVTLTTIGQSVENRPIKMLKISNNNPNNTAVLMEGGIHAREWISPAAVTYIVNQFVHNFDENRAVNSIDWYIVPVLNPDGYEYTHVHDRLWRKNRARGDINAKEAKAKDCMGVDLNRNFGFKWGTNGASKDPCARTYRGKAAFSEPETVALDRFVRENKNIKWRGSISVHSYGQYIVYPWAATTESFLHDAEDLDLVAIAAAYRIVSAGGLGYTTGAAGTTIYPASGSLMDWSRGAVGIKYAYTIELRDDGHFGFILPARFIVPTAQEALIAVRTIAEAVNNLTTD